MYFRNFESNFFNYLNSHQNEWINKKYVGLITYSIADKISVFDFNELSQKDTDVISFNNYYLTTMVKHAEVRHKNFIYIWKYILNKLGYDSNDCVSDDIPSYFNNYWMAKPEWMLKYIAFFNKAINIIENDDEISSYLYQNSNYNGKLPPNKLIEISGKPYYTFHPFIIERLPCFFFWHEKASLYQADAQADKLLVSNNITSLLLNKQMFLKMLTNKN